MRNQSARDPEAKVVNFRNIKARVVAASGRGKEWKVRLRSRWDHMTEGSDIEKRQNIPSFDTI